LTIIGSLIFCVWSDLSYESCGPAKTAYDFSLDGGESWSAPERLSNQLGNGENWPCMFVSTSNGHSFLHLVFSQSRGNQDWIYYSQNEIDLSGIEENNNGQAEEVIQMPNAYPNPFNSATTITLTGAEQAEIGIYDITGRLITTLYAVGGQALWDASGCSSGLYFARLAGEKAGTIKLILVK
jgi:hypothetical protein